MFHNAESMTRSLKPTPPKCKYYRTGACSFGRNCQNQHILCRDLDHCQNEYCTYGHSQEWGSKWGLQVSPDADKRAARPPTHPSAPNFAQQQKDPKNMYLAHATPVEAVPGFVPSKCLNPQDFISFTIHPLSAPPHPTDFPRSAAEAVCDGETKFRQLPCRTFISCGACPYGDRCVFLHDPRLLCEGAQCTTRLKNRGNDEFVVDALYWPAMPRCLVVTAENSNGAPAANGKHRVTSRSSNFRAGLSGAGAGAGDVPLTVQPYSVPYPQRDMYHAHDQSVYSLWTHFVDFCLYSTALSRANMGAGMLPAEPDPLDELNAYTEEPRLNCFRVFANGGRSVPAATRVAVESSDPALAVAYASRGGSSPGGASLAPPQGPHRRHSLSPNSVSSSSDDRFEGDRFESEHKHSDEHTAKLDPFLLAQGPMGMGHNSSLPFPSF
mmetsp:Transcript_5422/g.11848  ORF Transcript_5422/g.11848 Transcript_5422/m.11848 type:complete len:438 (+) Transcript_5422:68-1381(+)